MIQVKSINTPTVFVIFGITGDLSRRKLLPALFDLHQKGFLPTTFRIIGIGRSTYTDEAFRAYVHDVIAEKHGHNVDTKAFVSCIHYQRGDFTDAHAYRDIAQRLIAIDDTIGQCTNKLFYLAIAPVHYKGVLINLAHSGLTIPCSSDTGWTRVLIEKPFGSNITTAAELDVLLGRLFREEQIFRIDHYLAKETIQNILTFRFSNTLFEPTWNARYIERIEMTLAEQIDVGTRGAFYDGIGALRDVGQNHMLQTIATLMMDHPGTLDAAAIRRERTAILERMAIRLPLTENVVRAQYDGYRNVDGVAPDSQTETFFRITFEVNAQRWRGVPITITSGKALACKYTEVKVFFAEAVPCFCAHTHKEHRHQNIITFRIQPHEGIDMTFFAKRPGLGGDIEPRQFSFDYRETYNISEPDAYEKVLFDCIRGDQTLFASTAEVMATWRFVTPILEAWHALPLHIYASGSTPEEIITHNVRKH